jgi:uncharacterized protein YecT (DUF1311 family)
VTRATAALLVLFVHCGAHAETRGSEGACPDSSETGLLACLPGQIAESQRRLDAVFQQRLADLKGGEREQLSLAQATWAADVGPACEQESDTMDMRPTRTRVAVLECRLDMVNKRIVSLTPSP